VLGWNIVVPWRVLRGCFSTARGLLGEPGQRLDRPILEQIQAGAGASARFLLNSERNDPM